MEGEKVEGIAVSEVQRDAKDAAQVVIDSRKMRVVVVFAAKVRQGKVSAQVEVKV